LTPGNLYELSFDFTVNPGNGGHGEESSFMKWLEVDMSNSTIPQFYFSGLPSGTQTAVNLEYVRRAIDFTATGTSTTITLQALFPSGLPAFFPDGTPVRADTLYTGPVVDNIDLEDISFPSGGTPAPTPEPASLGVLAVGGLMLLRRRR
jgi:MYXO-CTERM domain-containing protein